MSTEKRKTAGRAEKKPRVKATVAKQPTSKRSPKRTGRKAKLDELQQRRGTLYVCRSCVWSEAEREKDGKRQGTFLYEAIQSQLEKQALPDKTSIRGVFCLNGCKKPCNVSYRSMDKFGLRFSKLTTENAADVLSTLAAYADSPDGDLAEAEIPEAMRGKMSVRTPPIARPTD